MPLKDLKAKVQAGSHRMTEDQLHWWEDFIKDEQTLRSRWDGMTDEHLKELACTGELVYSKTENTPKGGDASLYIR